MGEAHSFVPFVGYQRPVGRATHALIDLTAMRHNLARVRAAAPGTRVLAAIKANGYGHGLVRVAAALDGADALGVACINEAMTLRQAGIATPITLLEGFFHADELEYIARYSVETIVHHTHQLEALERARLPQPVAVWVKVDTGMHRLGLPPARVAETFARLRACPNVAQVRGFMTHLACADDLADGRTVEQLRLFEQATAHLPGLRTVANSAGVLGWPRSHYDLVRPGIMLYGVSPFIGGRAAESGLRPVMTLSSELIAINRVARGEAVGYGASWVCPEEMPVGVVSIGYGDGYPRHARAGTPVLVAGRRVPLIGRVSMDMVTVDLRGCPQARIGDPVVLWGAGLAVEEVAEHTGTIAYELLCGVTQRVAHVEVDGAP